jgi:lysophospholipase L1-like esterase
VPGTTTRDWTGPYAAAWLDQLACADGDPPEVVHIMLGVNDAVGFYEPTPVGVNEYRLRMAILIGALQRRWPGAEIWSSNPTRLYIHDDVDVHNRLAGYDEALHDLRELGVTKRGVDCRGMDLWPSRFHDGVHPNDEGHAEIARHFRWRIWRYRWRWPSWVVGKH